MNAAHRRRPTIRRVRDLELVGNLRLAPPPRDLRETLAAEADFAPKVTEDEALTLCPKISEVRGISVPRITDEADDEEHETLVWAPEESDDIKLDHLVGVFSKRAEALEEERKMAVEAAERAALRRAQDRERRQWRTARGKRRHRLLQLASEHRYKIIYSLICVWGLIQLFFVR